ncbi:MAG: N-formylglutamate amidohydrolase [Pseudomonadota bacterium]
MSVAIRQPGRTDVVHVKPGDGPARVVIVCEHASNRIPDGFDDLGLPEEALTSHIAWDPGTFEVADAVSDQLRAPMVWGGVSRLLYDCNRPPNAESAIPAHSEETVVPGNTRLTEGQRATRIDQFYRPFEALLAQTLANRPGPSVIVTIHSFTPVFHGEDRSVEIGVLHDEDSRLADALLKVADGFQIERNAPYGPEDGVTHTLRQHALPRRILNVMFEIRNDLIANPQQCETMAQTLADWLTQAIAICAEEGRA